jgi:hypothetical protein
MASLLKSRRVWAYIISIAGLLLVLLGPFLPERRAPQAYPDGTAEATADHGHGLYVVKVIYGPPRPPEQQREYKEYAGLLKNGYRVELDMVAGCVVTKELVRYVQDYNAVSERLLLEKFGRDIFEECHGLAKKKLAGGPPEK